tara:strand:+ start:991 stop:1389 length:399 start_codon:yes stop_codon:yes gene_type:complete
MGYLDNVVEYGFGQMGSGHIKAVASDLKPPKDRVIVAITMLENVKFDQLEADQGGASPKVDHADSLGEGINFIATDAVTRANGLDQSDSSAESVVIANTVEFPKGLTIYGRWKRVSLSGSDYTHGIIVYYGR